MIRPFPQDPKQRKAAHEAMLAAAPDLMADVAAIRAQFPGARMTHFKSAHLELGEAPKEGWEVSEDLCLRAAKDSAPSHEQLLAKREAEKRSKQVSKLKRRTK